MAPSDFDGQVALVTGGGSGIGRATCLQLARDGAHVVITDIRLEAARETMSMMSDPEDHLALQMDVTHQMAVERVIAAAKTKFGQPPSMLVNCAGITMSTPSCDVTGTTLDRIIDVYLKGTFLVTKIFTKALLEENSGALANRGAVVNISSIAGKIGSPKSSLYAATKSGVIAFSKSCAAEIAKKGIRVNCVLPGVIDTPMARAAGKEFIQRVESMTPLGRSGRAEEVAEVIVFLLSRRSSYMVGACVEVTGGFSM